MAQCDRERSCRILRGELNESRGARKVVASSDCSLSVEEHARIGLRCEVHERASARRRGAFRRERRASRSSSRVGEMRERNAQRRWLQWSSSVREGRLLLGEDARAGPARHSGHWHWRFGLRKAHRSWRKPRLVCRLPEARRAQHYRGSSANILIVRPAKNTGLNYRLFL